MQVRYVFGWGLVIGVFVFGLEFTNRDRYLDRRTWTVVLLTLVFAYGAIFTDPFHQLIWPEYWVADAPFEHLITQRGPGFWLLNLVAYVYAGAGIGLLITQTFFVRRASRWQSFLVAVALVPSLVIQVLQNAPFMPVPGFDYLAVTWSLFAIVIGYTLFRREFLSLTPISRATIMESVDAGIVVVTDDDRIVDYNDRARRIFPGIDGAVGARIEETVPALLEPTTSDEPRFVGRISRVTDGDRRRYAVDVTEDDDRSGATILVIRDVTEIEEYAHKLERQTEQLDQFASTVSHDLRNPLTVAAGRTNLALERDETNDLDKVASALERAEEIIEDALTLARHGVAPEDQELVPLVDLANEAWQTTATTDLTLVLDADPDQHIYTDPGRLKNAFENLFRNAVEHADPAGTIIVRTIEDGFYVEDDGPGIPPSKRDRVLERGHSGDRDGTGLGLSIVESIAAAHGWSIEVTEGSDGGARFEFIDVDLEGDVAAPSTA